FVTGSYDRTIKLWAGVAAPPIAKRTEWREMMEKRARNVSAFQVDKDTRTPVEMLAAPVYRYQDATRPYQEDTVWAWGRTGRPVALMALEVRQPGARPANPQVVGEGAVAPPPMVPDTSNQLWAHEFVSLSTGLVAAETSEGLRWSPKKPGLE